MGNSEIIIGILCGLAIPTVGALIYLILRVRSMELKYNKVDTFKTQLAEIKKVTRADEILNEIHAFEKHVTDLSAVVSENNKLIVSKFKEHEAVLVDQQKTIEVIAHNLKLLSDYVANSSKNDQ